MNLMMTPARAYGVPFLDTPGVEVWRNVDGTVCAVGYRRDEDHCLYVPNVGTFLFRHSSDEIRLVPDASARDERIQDAFHRIALPLALQLRGPQVLHASAVLIGDGVVALCGQSGAGKSTLAYALSRRDHQLWGDDAVAFDVDDGLISVQPLPFRVRLRPASAAWFDDLARLKGSELSLPWQRGSSTAAFRALFVLRRADADAVDEMQIRRLAPADAFTAVLPHAYYLALDDEDLNRRLLSAYFALADRLPVFALCYAPRLGLLDQMTERIEREVAAL